MAAILGIGDGILNTQISALLALLFKHDTVNIIKILLLLFSQLTNPLNGLLCLYL